MNPLLFSGMKGQYHELNDNGQARFFEIHFCEYAPEKIERLNAIGCLNDSRIGEYMALTKEPILTATRYLFVLTTYIGIVGIKDVLVFNQSISEYKKTGFASLESLLRYCDENWGVKKEDFKSILYTNIPH